MNEDLDTLLIDFYKKYANEDISKDKIGIIKETYGDDIDSLLKDLYIKYTGSELSGDKLKAIKDTYSLKKKEEEKILESISRPLQEGIISGTKRPTQVGELEYSPGQEWTKQSAEDRYSISKSQDLPSETQEDIQPQLESPKCDPATQVFDASSNQCVDISSVTEVFSDNEKITFNSLLKENPGLELSKNKRGNYILYSEGKLGREGQWYVLTDKGLEKGKDMGAEKGFTVGIDVIPMSDVDSFDYQEIQAEGPQDSFSITEKAENDRVVKRNKVQEAFKPDERDVTIREKELEKEKDLKLQDAADELYKTGFDSQRDGDLFRKYISEDEDRKAIVEQHLESLGLTSKFTADENQPYNNRSIKEAIKVAGKDYLQYLDQTKVQKTVQDYLNENMETYKDNPIISGALNIISKSPVVNALTSTADLVKNKTEIIKDLIEPRIEELNKNFNEFEQVYNTINSEYYNYEGDAPVIFDVDGASTAKAEAKMITDFNAEFVDPVTGIVNIPYDEVKKISEKTGLSEDDVRKFAKQYELLYMDNMDKDLDLEYTSFQLKRYNDFLSDAGMVDPNAKDHETALGKYYYDKENYGRNALKKFPFEDKEVTDEIFNTRLYDLNEDEFSNMMSGVFSAYGVNFYPVAKGSDVVKVVARNGEEFSINLMAYKKVKDKEGKRIKELQNFLERNTSSRNVLSLEDIAQLRSGFSLKSVDKKWMEYNKDKINNSADNLKNSNKEINNEIDQFNRNLVEDQKQNMKQVAASVGITEEEFNASDIGKWNIYVLENPIKVEKIPEEFMSLLNKGIQRQVDNGVIRTEEQLRSVQKGIENSMDIMDSQIERAQSSFNDHIIQKQENLNERALDFSIEFQDFYKATEKHYNMEAQMGSFLGWTWDSLLIGAESLGAGTTSIVFDLGEATGALSENQADKYREEYLPAIRTSLRKNYGAGTYDAYMQEMEKTFVGGAWGGLMKSMAPIAVSIASGGLGATAFAIQQVDYLDQEFEKDPDLKNLSLSDKWMMKAPIAIVNGVLEKFGVTQTLKGGNSLATRLLIRALDKGGGKGSAKRLVNILEADVDNLIARGLIRFGKGGITEFETGFLQQLNETSVKELYDHYIDDTNKNLFETVLDDGSLIGKGGISLLKEAAYAGAQEAIGGFIMAGPAAVNKGIQEKNLGKLSTDLQFEFIESVINDPMSRSMYTNLFKQLIASKKFSKYEVRMWQESLDKAEAIINQINPNADISDRKKSFDLINEKKNLEQEVAGKDKFTVQEKYDRINEINNELAEISKYASENVNTIGETPILNKVRQEDNITDADNEIIEQAENIIYGSPKDKKGATKGSKGQVVLTRDQVQKAKKELDELIDRLDNSGSLESMELADELRAMSEAVSNQPVNHSVYFNERVNDENAQKVHNELVEKNQFKLKTTYIINNKEVSAREFDGKMKDPAFQQELKDGKSSYSVINAPESKIAELEGMPTKPKEGKPTKKQEPSIKDSQIPTGKEIFTIETEEGEGVRTVEVITYKDGSRDVVQKVDGDVAGSQRVSKDNTLSNQEYVERGYGDITGESEVLGMDEVMNPKMREKLTDKQKEELGITEEVTPEVTEVVNILNETQKEAYLKLSKEDRKAVDEIILDEEYERSIGAVEEVSTQEELEDAINKSAMSFNDMLNNALGLDIKNQKADGEVFVFGEQKYDIDEAVNLANKEKINTIEIGVETLPNLSYTFVQKTQQGIENADISKPVIIATTKDGLLLIDGHHRVEKAIQENKPIKGIVLSESQTNSIQITETPTPEAAPTETRRVSKVRKATDKAVKAISKILPDVKIVLHETDQAYREATGEQNIEDSSNGEYNPKTKEIHINLSKATTGTVAHEVFHAVILNKLKTDAATSKVTKNMVNALSKTLEEGSELKKYLDDFVSDYDQNIQNEEKLAEMVAILAENYVQLSKPNQNLILRWLNKIAKAFGLKQFTEGEVIDLLNTISEKVAVGEEISEADIKIIPGETVEGAEGPIPDNIPDKEGPGINIQRKQKSQLDRGGIDLSTIKRGSINEMSGVNAFVFAADQATYGNVKSPSGLQFMFNGGYLYPYGAQSQGSDAVWVFSTETAANKVLNKAKNSDGVGVIMAQAKDGITGNLQFYDYINAEIAHAVEKGASPKDLIKYVNKKLQLTKVANGLKKKGLPTKINSLEELQTLLTTLNFEQRGSFAKTFLSKESYDKFGIYPFYGLKTIDGNIENVVNDPSISDVSYGDVISAVEFDKKGKPFKIEEGQPGYHPAYPWALPGKPSMVFDNAVDIRKVYPESKPVTGTQTPLSQREKAQAARSAMGGQYIAKIPSKIKEKGEVIKRKQKGKPLPVMKQKLDIKEINSIVSSLRKKKGFGPDSLAYQVLDELSKAIRNKDYEIDLQDYELNETVAYLADEGVTLQNIRNIIRYEGVEGMETNQEIESYFVRIGKGEKLTQGVIARLMGLKSKVKTEEGEVIKRKQKKKKPKKITTKQIIGKPKRKKIVVDDVAALKDQIRLEARAARGAVKAYKDISKSIIEDVRKLSKKGVITPAQSSAIINKVLSTNMMNPKMVDRLTEYIDKVYKKAELAEKIKITRDKISKAKTNLQSKVGASPELQNVLDELFSIDPSLIPLDKFDSYFEIIERFGAGKAVLDLPEAGEVMSQATDIINSVDTNIEEEVKDPVSKEKNKEIEDNLDSYIADIISEKINTENLYNQEGKDIADYLSKLTKEDLLSLVKEKKDGTKDYSDLEKLKLVKNNMSNGFVPKMSMDLKIKVESNRSSKEINDVVSKVKETSILTGFSRIYGSLKTLFMEKGSRMTESVRGTPTFYIDDIFGNFNSKTIWNNTFGRLAKAYSRYESDLAKNVTSKLDAAEVLLSKTKIPTIQRQRNDIQRSKVKIMAYRLQREFESNPGSKQVASANSFIEETINAMGRREVNSKLNEQEIKILKEIQDEFLVDGEISLDKIEKSFTSNEKKALDLIDEIGVYLEPKAVFTSSVIRGGKIKPINNYVHHSVTNKDKVKDLNNKKEKITKPSTKAGTLRERTPGAKPINFDPISSTLSGATETLLDYHMTEVVKTVNASIKKAKDQIDNNKESSSISKESIDALKESVDEVMGKTFSNSFIEYDPFSKTIKKLQKLGYQAALASVPRAGAELGSNMLFAISSNPQAFINGVKKYSGFAMGNEGMNAMENLGSTETMKLYDTKNMTGKMADSNLLYTGKPKASKAVSPVVEKAEYLLQFSGVKQIRKFADELSDKLISTPDKAVSRPLWFGNFSNNFKKITGITLTEKDFIEIADGSSKYLSKEYKQAVEESTKFADQESVKMATSSNPFNVIPKNISTPDDGVFKQIYKNANSYMARFSQYEYATARNAIVSLFKAGKLTKKQALGTLIGTQMRMASYMILYSALRSAFDSLFGFEDEEEEDYKTMIKRQLVGSPLSLLTGRGLGNVPKIAINYGLELFNEEYLEDLRDGKKYDPFKHSLVFSQISPGDKRDPYEIFLNTMTGPLSPLAKTAARTYKVYTKTKPEESKKAETRAKYKEELSTRMLLEGLGNLGFIPFYKDIRRMFLKDFFKGYKKEQKAKEEKKKAKEEKKYEFTEGLPGQETKTSSSKLPAAKLPE